MADVDTWLIDGYQLARHRVAKPLTLKSEFGTLGQFLEYCQTLGLVDDNLSLDEDNDSDE